MREIENNLILLVQITRSILLFKQLRMERGVKKNDHLMVKSLSKGKILLEKPKKRDQKRARTCSTGP